MANLNATNYAALGKSTAISTNNYRPITNNYPFIHEPNSTYGDDDPTKKIAALLNLPLWPQFPDGAFLNIQQATRFYRAAHGIQGLVHILNRSAFLRDTAQLYDDEPDRSLSKPQESQLWAALIEIGADLANLADDLRQRAEDNLLR